MTLYLKFDFHATCKKVLEDTLQSLDIKYNMVGFGEVELLEKLSSEKTQILSESLQNYNIIRHYY